MKSILTIKRNAKISILSLLLVVTILSVAPLVSAQEPTPRLPKMGPFSGPSDSNPYMAGYQEDESGWSSDRSTTTRVRITVSFPNTPPPGQTIQDVIPADNYIAGGMFLQSQGSQAFTDYGWVASLSLDHEGTLQYNMAFYETYEMIPQHCWEIWSDAIVLDGVDPSTPVTLTMQWVAGGVVEWLYEIGGQLHWAANFDALGYRGNMHDYFYIGIHYSTSMQHWCYYYQFGMYSEDRIANNGWNVRLEHPKYYTSTGRWKCVLEAQSIGGFTAYMDSWWSWGGANYNGVWARFYGEGGDPGTLPGFEVEFYYGDCHGYSRLPNHWTLWNNPPTEPETPERPRGETNPYTGYTYSYSTITVDPNDNYVTYYFDWGDGTHDQVGPWPSGVERSASHSWSSPGYYTIRVQAHDTTGRWSDRSLGLTVHVCPPGTWDLLDQPWDSITGWNLLGSGISEISPPGQFHNMPNAGTGVGRYRVGNSLPEEGYTAEFRVLIDSFGTGDGSFEYQFYDGLHRVWFGIYADRIYNPDSGTTIYVTTNTDQWYFWRLVIDSDWHSLKVYRDGVYLGDLGGGLDYTIGDGGVYASYTRNPSGQSGCESHTDYTRIARAEQVQLDVDSKPVDTGFLVDGYWRGVTNGDPITVISGWHDIGVYDIVRTRKQRGPHTWVCYKYEFDCWTISGQGGMVFSDNPIHWLIGTDGAHLTAHYELVEIIYP